MNVKLRPFLLLVIIVLLFSFIPINEVDAQSSSNYVLSSVAGEWTSVHFPYLAGWDYVTGLNTNEIRWGATSGDQSGMRFIGSTNVTFNEADEFRLGTLTHLNFPVQWNTPADQATLRITLNFSSPSVSPDPSFTFDFDIYETSNAWPCDFNIQQTYTPCDDQITFPEDLGTESFTIGDKFYTLKIEGFEDSAGNPVPRFITEEYKETDAFLVASLSSVLVEAPDVTLTKKTNDLDVGSAPGPELVVGENVTWDYIVQNTGNVDLSNIQVVDDKVGSITCPDTDLDSGASMTCSATGTVAAGQYQNQATVTASHSTGSVTDSDKSWYHGVQAAINVEKSVLVGSTWVDADSSPGPSIASGSDVLFKFFVQNTGDVDLSGTDLSDNKIASLYSDQGLNSSCLEPDPFVAGTSFTCYGSLAWKAGQHENEATIKGGYDGQSYEDKDKSHYFGASPAIDVEKAVYDGSNWVDADSSPGPSIASGSDALFKFFVKNTGNVDLTGASLSDSKIASLYSDQGLNSPCVEPDPFTAGTSFTCYGTLAWKAGQHENEATIKGAYDGQNYEDKDKSHYFGASPAIDVEKAVYDGSNWVDADSSPGPSLSSGSDVLFSFKVVNTGNVDLSGVSLSDNKIASLYSDQSLTSPCVEPNPFTAGTSFTCYGSLAWKAGQHENEAIIKGGYDGQSFEDKDKSHYFGASPAIDVEKAVYDGSSWVDADSGSGPILASGSDVLFKFFVKNTGNVDLTGVSLSDSKIASLYSDQGLNSPCVEPDPFTAGTSFTCYGSLAWKAGQHENEATVSGTSDGQSYEDKDKTHYFGLAPAIDVEKRVLAGSSWADADTAPGPYIGSGSDVLFQFIVTNTGNVTLSGVALSDNFIANLYSDQALSIPCEENDPFGVGESFTCYGSLAWQSGQHKNTALVSGSYNDHHISDDDLAHYFGASVSIDVEKSVWDGTAWNDADTGNGPTLLDGSDPIFKFDVTNTSNVALTNIVLEDNLISSLFSDQTLTTECVEPETLSVDASFTCFGTLPWAAGKHENKANVSADSNNIPASDSDLAHYLGGSPKIKLTKTADVDVYQQKDQIITYTFVAENTGNLTLYDVKIADPLPGLSVLDCSVAMPATLSPGSTMTCTATYQVKQDDMDRGYINNNASVKGTDIYEQTVEDDDDLNLEGPKEGASIQLEKTANPEIYVAVGDEITYTFVATNNGSFTLTNVMIEDPMPDLSGLTCSPAQPSTLQPGDSMTCTATYSITQADVNNGKVENSAIASGIGSNDEEVDDDDGAVIEGPKEEASVHLDKQAAPAIYKKVGDEIAYTFTVTNNGIYTLMDVIVTDPLFGLSFGPIDEMAPGDSEVYKYTYTITQADLDAGYIENVATAMGYDPEEVPVSDTDDATVDYEKPKETVETLPTTGFAPNRITNLPAQSLDMAYTVYSEFWLEIPSLGVKVDIVGVPETESGWDVTWLGEDAGWLNGTTFPTWPGNAVVTGHVWNAFDQAGPFVDLHQLKWGDKIIVHLYGSSYVFEVRSKLTVEPTDMSLIEKEEDYSWLNLMTCRDFNEETDLYDFRLIVRAVLIDVE